MIHENVVLSTRVLRESPVSNWAFGMSVTSRAHRLTREEMYIIW